MTLQNDVVGLQAEQGEHGSICGQVSDRLPRGQHSGLATEGAQQSAPGWSHQAEVGQAFHAEGVAAVQHFGGMECVVEGVPADRALRLPALLLFGHPQTRRQEAFPGGLIPVASASILALICYGALRHPLLLRICRSDSSLFRGDSGGVSAHRSPSSQDISATASPKQNAKGIACL